MYHFSTSKARELVMTPAVRDLLLFEHPDLEFRTNVHVLASGEVWDFGSSSISVVSAGHMLGACQAVVTLKDGLRVGYSGDFSWPLEDVVEVDALVVDATYGTPDSDRSYDQVSADNALVELVRDQLGHGPVQLSGGPGVIERALMIIGVSDVAEGVPILGNARLCASVDVHRQYGWPMKRIVDVNGTEGINAIRSGSYIRCWQLSEGGRVGGLVEGATISLTKYRARNVVEELAGSNFRVGMSNHADYRGTVEYVRKTGAKYVVTDARRSRDGRANILANSLSEELGVRASPSTNAHHHRWE